MAGKLESKTGLWVGGKALLSLLYCISMLSLLVRKGGWLGFMCLGRKKLLSPPSPVGSCHVIGESLLVGKIKLGEDL